ncbi:hypothetical protein Efla_005794 [Eimeria flavescens]
MAIKIVKKLARAHGRHSAAKNSVCLVLGGTGLLGKALLERVKELDEQAGDLDGYGFVFASSSDADLRVWHETVALFSKHQPSAIIHLAAKVGGLYDNMENNEVYLSDNVLINTNVVQAAIEAKVPRAIFCLSTCAYPENVPQLPLVEEYLHLAPPHPSNEGYAAAKRLLEQQVRFGRERLQAENPGDSFVWMCVIPCNLYGPHDNFSLKTAHVLPALVHKTALAQRDGGMVTVRGTGQACRQFLFSADAARLLLLLLVKRELPEDYCLMNMCPDLEDGEVSIKNLAAIVKKCSDFDGEIELASRAACRTRRNALVVSSQPADNAKLRSIIGQEFFFTSLEEGVQKTVNWFKSNMKNARK